MPADPDAVTNPSLSREDLTPAAREPLEDHSGQGWGAFYSGPHTENADRPLLDQLDVPGAPDPEDDSNPRQVAHAPGGDPWGNPSSRDFRREPYDYNQDGE